MNEPAELSAKSATSKIRLVSVNENPVIQNRYLRLLKRQYPSLLVILISFVGLLVANITDFRVGTYILAGALGLATFFRLTFSRFAVGWLAVRHRAVDIAILLTFTLTLVVLAIVVPA
jgi:hypothetical protein